MSNRNTLFVMLGDFTGHGLPAALGALPVKQQFDAMVSEGASVGDIARQLNATLYDYLPGNMFCAATIVELSNDGHTATCWMGGLPDMFVLNNEGLIRESLGSTHMALGVFSDKQFKRDVLTIDLADEEKLILYSDGVIECSDIDGNMLAEAGFEAIFDGKTPIDGLFDHLIETITRFAEGRPQDDDVSLLEINARPIGLVEPGARADWYSKNFSLSWQIDSESLQSSDPVQDLLDLWAVPVSLRAAIDDIYVSISRLLRNVVESEYKKATGSVESEALMTKKLGELAGSVELDPISLLARYDAKAGSLLLAANVDSSHDYVAGIDSTESLNFSENGCCYTTIFVGG